MRYASGVRSFPRSVSHRRRTLAAAMDGGLAFSGLVTLALIHPLLALALVRRRRSPTSSPKQLLDLDLTSPKQLVLNLEDPPPSPQPSPPYDPRYIGFGRPDDDYVQIMINGLAQEEPPAQEPPAQEEPCGGPIGLGYHGVPIGCEGASAQEASLHDSPRVHLKRPFDRWDYLMAAPSVEREEENAQILMDVIAQWVNAPECWEGEKDAPENCAPAPADAIYSPHIAQRPRFDTSPAFGLSGLGSSQQRVQPPAGEPPAHNSFAHNSFASPFCSDTHGALAQPPAAFAQPPTLAAAFGAQLDLRKEEKAQILIDVIAQCVKAPECWEGECWGGVVGAPEICAPAPADGLYSPHLAQRPDRISPSSTFNSFASPFSIDTHGALAQPPAAFAFGAQLEFVHRLQVLSGASLPTPQQFTSLIAAGVDPSLVDQLNQLVQLAQLAQCACAPCPCAPPPLAPSAADFCAPAAFCAPLPPPAAVARGSHARPPPAPTNFSVMSQMQLIQSQMHLHLPRPTVAESSQLLQLWSAHMPEVEALASHRTSTDKRHSPTAAATAAQQTDEGEGEGEKRKSHRHFCQGCGRSKMHHCRSEVHRSVLLARQLVHA
mmetsp:Transcript_25461/g.59826  ORF Transcript_25461/g.59826 Transcript_25461/m.59826 type:complete len:603 (+) Transcript_25461:1-1809(+)